MSPQKTISPLAWLLLIALGAIWGGIFPAAKLLLEEVGPVTIVAQRTFWAALALWGIALLRGATVPRSLSVWVGFAGMGLINNVIPFSLIFWAQQHIEAGLAAILNGSTAIFGVLVAAIFLPDERLTPRKIVGVVLGFIGVATVIGLEHLEEFNLRSAAQLMLLGATLSYAFAGVWARKMLAGVAPDVSAAGMLTFAALVTIPGAWALGEPFSLAYSTPTLLLLAYVALAGTALAFLLYYRVLALAGSSNLLLVTLLVAPFAILISTLLLGERLTPNALAGFGIIALGLAVIDGRLVKLIRR